MWLAGLPQVWCGKIFIYFPDIAFAKTRRPSVDVAAESSIKIAKENDLVFRRDFKNCSAEILIKLIFGIRC